MAGAAMHVAQTDTSTKTGGLLGTAAASAVSRSMETSVPGREFLRDFHGDDVEANS